ncbi:NADPH-dependent 7-cyano-7-deazaguanine reductase QueF [bacterium]|nr:NADPH-dependent 7-cyano-7-deazaguanine reductase QueF [bacterium]
MTVTDDIASTLLGKKIEGLNSYTPSILVAIPRNDNRQKYKIQNDNLPFNGFDIWHCYEFSALTENNLPVTRVLKLRYMADSPFIIESKSLKLYLNSFNFSNFGRSSEECLKICKRIIEKDLSEKLQTVVEVNFFDNEIKKTEIFENFDNIMNFAEEKDLKIDKFKETPELIEIIQNDKIQEHYLKFDSLRSNCRVTHQPDFGDCFIYYQSSKHILESSLIKYLVSFRNEFHFHEECCEMIYKRLYDLLDKDDKLMVCALYTRRGGIDITPVRYSKGLQFDDLNKIYEINNFARCGIKQ